MSTASGSLSAEQNQRLEEILGTYVEEGAISTALLVDHDGHLISQWGEASSVEPVSFGALVSANFASTQQIATQMGETEFSAFFIQGNQKDLYIHAVGDSAVLVSIFPNTTKLGMVKVFAEKTVKDLAETLAAGGGGEGMSVGGGFADTALEELDTILGG